MNENKIKAKIQAYSDSHSHAAAAIFYKIKEPKLDEIFTQMEYLIAQRHHLYFLRRVLGDDAKNEITAQIGITSAQSKVLFSQWKVELNKNIQADELGK